jgi:hypothetical protein
MTKRKSEAERENDATNRAAMKEWTKRLGHKPTPEDMQQRAIIAATPAQRKHEKKEFERGKKAGYAWADSGRSIVAVEAVVNFWVPSLIAAKKYGPNLRTRWSKRSVTMRNLRRCRIRTTFTLMDGMPAFSPPTK